MAVLAMRNIIWNNDSFNGQLYFYIDKSPTLDDYTSI